MRSQLAPPHSPGVHGNKLGGVVRVCQVLLSHCSWGQRPSCVHIPAPGPCSALGASSGASNSRPGQQHAIPFHTFAGSASMGRPFTTARRLMCSPGTPGRAPSSTVVHSAAHDRRDGSSNGVSTSSHSSSHGMDNGISRSVSFTGASGITPAAPVTGYGSHPPPQIGDLPAWTDNVMAEPVEYKRRIFCNRALNLRSIKAIGFDMDYTLAQYKPENFEALAYKETVKKLVGVFRYPSELLSREFDPNYMTKGLIIDKGRGNMLKVDRHKYVKLAYHGFKALTAEERKGTYEHSHMGPTFDESDFAMVDTLFSLAESYLYMQLVELKDAKPESDFARKGYKDLYRDLRTAVDMCHRDGSLKRAVAASPQNFIHEDPLLPHMLTSLRDSGKAVFLATNSLWDYTHVVMNYLLFHKTGTEKTTEWLRYFDAVVVGCNKPSFFTRRAPLFSVDTATGMLKNTDNGAPIIPIDETDMSDNEVLRQPPGLRRSGSSKNSSSSSSRNGSSSGNGTSGQNNFATLSIDDGSSSCNESSCSSDGLGRSHTLAKVYQGGYFNDLHKKLSVNSGDEVLYVGDHIYGDIVKSKKDIGWRTMLVVPELQVELELEAQSQMVLQELTGLRDQRDAYADQIQRLQWSVDGASGTVAADYQVHAKRIELLQELQSQLDALKARHSALLAAHHRRFHPIWGQLLKTGHQNSRYAHQIERFACLYTSHVSNLAFVSPLKTFMGRMDYLAHEEQGRLESGARMVPSME